MNKIESLFASQNVEFEILPKKDCWKYQQKWREIYSMALHEKTGKWTKDQFDWHVFSFKYTHALSGTKAWNKYRKLCLREYLVLPNLNDDEGYLCNSSSPINLCGKAIDAYICPLDFSWTFVNTHEEGVCGPYFSEIQML